MGMAGALAKYLAKMKGGAGLVPAAEAGAKIGLSDGAKLGAAALGGGAVGAGANEMMDDDDLGDQLSGLGESAGSKIEELLERLGIS